MYKRWCDARGRKLEESQLNWALLAEVVRTGGLKMPLLMRLTYIPSHCASFLVCLPWIRRLGGGADGRGQF